MPSATIAVLGTRPLVRRGLEMLLREGDAYELAPGYARVEEVHARDEQVDVLVVDLDRAMVDELAGGPPLDVSHVVGVHDRHDPAVSAWGERSGVHSLVRYEDDPSTLLLAIEGRLDDAAPAAGMPARAVPSLLTARETEVLGLIADGLTTRDVSVRLGISPRTVENYKQHLFGKLGVQSRAHAVAVASRMGLLGPVPSLAAPAAVAGDA